jgi:hypothetical protein
MEMQAQSADSKNCVCFRNPVSGDFMLSTKVFYGRIGLVPRRDELIQPQMGQSVRFNIPTLESKQGCQSWYSIYIADEAGNKVYESAGSNPVKTYSFQQCNTTFDITLVAYSKSSGGGDGPCSRRLHLKIKPLCPTLVCNCTTKRINKVSISGDLDIRGRVECLGFGTSQINYVVKFDIVNKSDCILNIQSMTLLGQTIEVPTFNTPPKSETRGLSLGFSIPLSQAPPGDGKDVSSISEGSILRLGRNLPVDPKTALFIRYTLNAQACSTSLDLSFADCLR